MEGISEVGGRKGHEGLYDQNTWHTCLKMQIIKLIIIYNYYMLKLHK